MPSTRRDDFDEPRLHLAKVENENMENSPMRVLLLVLLVVSTGCEKSNTNPETSEGNGVQEAAETDASVADDDQAVVFVQDSAFDIHVKMRSEALERTQSNGRSRSGARPRILSGMRSRTPATCVNRS